MPRPRQQSLFPITETDPKYSVEDYINAVTVILILNIGQELVNTPLYQNWIYVRTALIQSTLDGGAQKRGSVLPKDITLDWKKITKNSSHKKCQL